MVWCGVWMGCVCVDNDDSVGSAINSLGNTHTHARMYASMLSQNTTIKAKRQKDPVLVIQATADRSIQQNQMMISKPHYCYMVDRRYLRSGVANICTSFFSFLFFFVFLLLFPLSCYPLIGPSAHITFGRACKEVQTNKVMVVSTGFWLRGCCIQASS